LLALLPMFHVALVQAIETSGLKRNYYAINGFYGIKA
jgi:hypothetical protein